MHAALFLMLHLLACSGDSDVPAAVVVTQPSQSDDGTPPANATNQLELSLDMKQSSVQWVGAKVTGKHTGGFANVEGDVRVEGGLVVGTRATIQISSLFSDTEKLTKHLLSPDFFNMGSFATSTFEATRIEPHPDVVDMHLVQGKLSLHGLAKEISFPAKITVTEALVHVAAEFTIDRQIFGIDYPGKPDNLIKDAVLIQLDLTYVTP